MPMMMTAMRRSQFMKGRRQRDAGVAGLNFASRIDTIGPGFCPDDKSISKRAPAQHLLSACSESGGTRSAFWNEVCLLHHCGYRFQDTAEARDLAAQHDDD